MITELLRLYQSAADPADIDEMRRLFLEDVKPAFTARPGCLSMELAVNVEPSPGGLVEGAAVSRWTSAEAMKEAIASREIQEALVRVRNLLRQEPVIKVLEVLE
ncbi:MAG: hypothetical protein M3179_13020 [Actinomycetota bacterium]|nr:hypothetical protein [Actinomycetota bacterium]